MIAATADSFRRSGQRFATVSVTISPPSCCGGYLAAYSPRALGAAADQLFLMVYDMWHHHSVCAGPNAPLPAVKSAVETILQHGAPADKLILGLPWVGEPVARVSRSKPTYASVSAAQYGYEYRCNSSIHTPTTSCSVPGLGTPSCLTGTLQAQSELRLSVGWWAVDDLMRNSSAGCTRGWSEEFGSPYLNCPPGVEPYHGRPRPTQPAWS